MIHSAVWEVEKILTFQDLKNHPPSLQLEILISHLEEIPTPQLEPSWNLKYPKL